jgi:hypothetical protein
MTSMIDPRLLLLSPLDNVVIARDTLPPVRCCASMAMTFAWRRMLPVATSSLAAPSPWGKGTEIRRPIGSADPGHSGGEHVHLHNIKSDYTATHIIGSPATEAKQ